MLRRPRRLHVLFRHIEMLLALRRKNDCFRAGEPYRERWKRSGTSPNLPKDMLSKAIQ